MNEKTPQASQESAIERHLKLQRDLDYTVEFLKRISGNDIRFNEYRDTIISLEGIKRGIRISDNAQEVIWHEREKQGRTVCQPE